MKMTDDGSTITLVATHKDYRDLSDMERLFRHVGGFLANGYKLKSFEVREGERTQEEDTYFVTVYN